MTKVSQSRTRSRTVKPQTPPAAAPPPALGARQRQKLDTRDRIRAAAWELFTSVGYDATTTKDVARRAGVAAGTVFLHARDKADLLFLVMHDRIAATVDAQVATLPPRAPLLEQLMHLFRGIFRMYGEHPQLAAAFVRYQPGAQGPNAEKVNALTFSFLHQVASLLREAQARGEVSREVEPLLAANNIFMLYFGVLLSWLSGYATLETALDPQLRAALALQIRGLR